MYKVFNAGTSRSFCVITLMTLVGATAGVPLYAQQGAPNQTVTSVVTCVSRPGERQTCKADTGAGVALLHSTGAAACLLGKNWGYDAAGVWVSDGCGGEFV